jgi:hypothetical protein
MKVKIAEHENLKLPICLIYLAMESYGRMEVQLHHTLPQL